MRSVLIFSWRVASIVVPIVSGIVWSAYGHLLPGAVGIGTGLLNGALLARRRIPLRIPSFVPGSRRAPLVIESLRYPGNG